ncbi:MAG: hypothetical protein E7037_06625 [Verrucomicrobia bacterium]|nr:hypothetical protein [Verrucomicrobiota bacterium]
MSLTTEQLEDLLEKIQGRIFIANRDGSLCSILTKIGWQDLLDDPGDDFGKVTSYPTGKIIVIGASSVKKEHLLGIAKGFGISKNRFEFIDFEEAKTFNYGKLQYNGVYRVVLAGPIPHKTTGTGDSSSAIVAMEKGLGFPRVVRLRSSNELKITKQSFKEGLSSLLSEGFLQAV